MTSPMNVYNQDGFPSIANALLFGTTLVPLNQSTATTGYIPQIQTNGGLTLTAPSGLGITWADVLAAGNTSGANNAIMSAGQALNFADGTVKINGSVAGTNSIAIGTSSSASANNDIMIGNIAVGTGTGGNKLVVGFTSTAVAARDIVIGSNSSTVGTTGGAADRIAIGGFSTAGANSAPYSIAIGAAASSTGNATICIGRSTTGTQADAVQIGRSASSVLVGGVAIGLSSVVQSGVSIGNAASCGTSSSDSVAIGRTATVNASAASSIALGPTTICASSNDICIGSAATTVGGNPRLSRVAIGQGATAGSASSDYSIAVGSGSSGTGSSAIAIGRLATASPLQSISIGISTSTAGNNDIAFGSNANTTNGARTARVAIGVNCAISGDQAIGIGPNVTITHNNSTAIGRNATSTADNQVMLGNNATGATNHIFGSVGTTGLMESAGYLVSFNQVRGSISAGGAQVVATGAGFTTITMATVDYASDYGSPAITSVASQLQTRANRCMTGFLNLTIAFAGAPAVNGFFNVRIQKNTNGAITTIASHSVFVLAAVTDYNISIPFSHFNATTPAANVFYYCDADNPAGFTQNYTVLSSTHFVGQMTN